MQNGGLRTKGFTKTNKIGCKLITIITVVYNGAETLEQTILSVIEQSYGNIEYILIDGGSTDSTIDIIKKYDDKIDYWQSEPDNGVYDAMNKGILLANGEYIYILGSDDWLYDKNVINYVVNSMPPNCDVFSGCVWQVYKNKIQRLFKNNVYNTKNEDINRCDIKSPHQGMFVRTEVMKNNLFDINYKLASDFKLLLSLWYNSEINIYKSKQIIAFYSNEGLSGHNFEKRKQESFMILKEFGLEKSEWVSKFNMVNNTKKSIKSVLKIIGVKKIYELLHELIEIKNKELKIHECDWDNCRYCSTYNKRKLYKN